MKNTDKLTQWYNQEINAFALLKLYKDAYVKFKLNIPVVGKFTYEGTAEEVMDALDASIAENDRIHVVAFMIADVNTIYIEAYSR